MSKNRDQIPPTEPTPRTTPGAAQAVAEPGPQTPPSTRITGASLLPNLAPSVAVAEAFWYWIGLLPNCPVNFVDVHGVHFPMMTEAVRRTKDGRTERIPQTGTLVQLRRDDIERLRGRLPRTVIRFVETKGRHVEPGSGKNTGDPIELGRKGFLVTIPRTEDVEARRKAGFSTQPYVQDPRDEPAVRYMFAALCRSQNQPSRGEALPESLETTGLEWPGTLE